MLNAPVKYAAKSLGKVSISEPNWEALLLDRNFLKFQLSLDIFIHLFLAQGRWFGADLKLILGS